MNAPNHTAPVEVLVADPPWPFKDKLPGDGRGAEKKYQLMTIPDIMRFPLPVLADNAMLILWRVGSMQPETLEVVRAWGFTVKSEIVWVKSTKDDEELPEDEQISKMGMGRYVRNEHEVALVCTRGRFVVADKGVRSTFRAPIGRHSEKPAKFFELVERLAGKTRMGEQTLCEIFGRVHRTGWHVYGNEIPNGHAYVPNVMIVNQMGPEFAKTAHHEVVHGKLAVDPTVTDEAIRAAAGEESKVIAGGFIHHDARFVLRNPDPWEEAAKAADEAPEEDDHFEPSTPEQELLLQNWMQGGRPSGDTQLINVPLAPAAAVAASPEAPAKAKRGRKAKEKGAAAVKIEADGSHVTPEGHGGDPDEAEQALREASTERLRTETTNKRIMQVWRGVAEKLITVNEASNVNEAITILTMRAPVGWFKAPIANLPTENLSQLAADLDRCKAPVSLLTICAWSPFQRALAASWAKDGDMTVVPEMIVRAMVEGFTRGTSMLPAGKIEMVPAVGTIEIVDGWAAARAAALDCDDGEDEEHAA